VRGYVSTAIECPYAGRVDPVDVASVVDRLLAMGVDEVSLGDTIGVAVPNEVQELARALEGRPKHKIAWHFHDTRGTGIANLAAAFELGYSAFDASAGGLGGCPYAPGAGGNLATEDASYFLERSGVATGIDLDRLARASREILEILGRAPTAKSQLAAVAAAARCAT
jgi:hydroxymethylglutaryl-CoA lyase